MKRKSVEATAHVLRSYCCMTWIFDSIVNEITLLQNPIQTPKKGPRPRAQICDNCVEVIAHEIEAGCGAVLLKHVLDSEQLDAIKREIDRLLPGSTVGELGDCHRRIWNLVNKGRVFEQLVAHPVVMRVLSAVLGNDFALGSFSANILMPACPRGEIHVDYPYSCLDKFPKDTIAMQVTTLLDDFNTRNGGTMIVPKSQLKHSQPDVNSFDKHAKIICGEAGDMLVYNSQVWHCSGENKSSGTRTALLGQYLCKYVRPMEDQINGVSQTVHSRASKDLRQLLALDFAFPSMEAN